LNWLAPDAAIRQAPNVRGQVSLRVLKKIK